MVRAVGQVVMGKRSPGAGSLGRPGEADELCFNTVNLMNLWDMQEEAVVEMNLNFKEFVEHADSAGQGLAMYMSHIYHFVTLRKINKVGENYN